MKRLIAVVGAAAFAAALVSPVSAARANSLVLVTPAPYTYLQTISASWSLQNTNAVFLEQCVQGSTVVDKFEGYFIGGIYSGTLTVRIGNNNPPNVRWDTAVAAQCFFRLAKRTGQQDVLAEVNFSVGPS